ncbi:hypothetical protein D3C81_2206280 [compost metagenome]
MKRHGLITGTDLHRAYVKGFPGIDHVLLRDHAFRQNMTAGIFTNSIDDSVTTPGFGSDNCFAKTQCHGNTAKSRMGAHI